MAVDNAETPPASAYADPDAPEPELAPERGTSSSRYFPAAAAAAAILLALFVAWASLHPGSGGPSDHLDDVVELVAAAAAAASCVVFGRNAAPPMRLAWLWIGASAACWAVGEAIVSWYELVSGPPVPFPSVADAFFLAALAAGRHRRAAVPVDADLRHLTRPRAPGRHHRGRVAAHRELDHGVGHRLPHRFGQCLLSGRRACLSDRRHHRCHRRDQRPRAGPRSPARPAHARRRRPPVPHPRRQQSRRSQPPCRIVLVRQSHRSGSIGRLPADRARPPLAARAGGRRP